MKQRLKHINLAILPQFEKAILKDMSISDLGLEINKTQEKVILFVSDKISSNMSEISQMVGVEKGSFTTTIDGLIHKGFIERLRSNEDRRIIQLSLTEKGVEAAKIIKKRMEEHLNEKFANFTDDEVDELIQAIGIIADFTAKINSK